MLFPLKRRTWSTIGGDKKWVHAVDGVSLELYRGECLALVGESGSGKTTLANCVAGSLVPVRGEIWLDDTMIAGAGKLTGLNSRERAKRIQVIFQDPTSALNRRLRVGSALAEPLLVHGICDRAEAEKRVDALLARVGLSAETADQYPHELNASQRQRVVIARALALEPEVLIADEPIAKLDVSMQGQILNLIDQLRRELGLSVIFITHDLSVVRQVATRVAVLYLGQLMEVQETEQFFRSGGHPYSQALLKSTPRLRVGAEDHVPFTIRGEIPSPIDVPPGCPFLSRCPEGDESCGRTRPNPRPTSANGFVACFKRGTTEASEPPGVVAGESR
jgi:oligopeptide/dipeptide ABC transporter ATP-binding protein